MVMRRIVSKGSQITAGLVGKAKDSLYLRGFITATTDCVGK